MFRVRSKLQRRDRDSGLVFSWRVPLSSSMSFVMAVILTSLIALGIGTFVKVRIGDSDRVESRRGSLILVGGDMGGMRLERMAIEAGPFPSRWNPAADPEYAALRGRALREASAAGMSYRGNLVKADPLAGSGSPQEGGEIGVLPALPKTQAVEDMESPRVTALGVRVVRSENGAILQIPQLPLGAGEAVVSAGRRFLIEYDEAGRIIEVIALDPDDTPADLSAWLARARVVEHKDTRGWVVVESMVAP